MTDKPYRQHLNARRGQPTKRAFRRRAPCSTCGKVRAAVRGGVQRIGHIMRVRPTGRPSRSL